MAIIYSYPVTAASLSDTMVVSDVSAAGKPTKSISVSGIKTVIDVVDKITDINGSNGQTGDIKFSGSNTIDIDFNAGANSITFDTKSIVPIIGVQTETFLPVWGDPKTLVSSLIKQDTSVPSVTITQNARLDVNQIFPDTILDTNGGTGSASQVLTASTSGGKVEWATISSGGGSDLQILNDGVDFTSLTSKLNVTTGLIATSSDSGVNVSVAFNGSIKNLANSGATNDSSSNLSSIYLGTDPQALADPNPPLSNTLLGADTGGKLTSGNNNTIIGSKIAKNLETGSENTIVGSNTTAEVLQSGNKNTFIGSEADGTEIDTASAVVLGYNASVASSSVAIGAGSGAAATGCVAIGAAAKIQGATSVGGISIGGTVSAAAGIAIGQGALATSNVLSLGASGSALATSTPDNPSIEKYLDVVINGDSFLIALYAPPS